MRQFFLLGLALMATLGAAAQHGALRLRVVDSLTQEPVIGAVAGVRRSADTTAAPLFAATNIDGEVLFPHVRIGDADVTVSSLGYAPATAGLRISASRTSVLEIALQPSAQSIEEVVLEVPALRSSVRGDTLSYRASAFKVAFGADTESLIGKMPGLEVAEGALEAQGRTVQKVFVDGREFFGNDVMSALRNIPADMVESIDVFHTQSDQSELTGVDNGEGYTALNIVTLPDKRRGTFGRLFGGYGIPDKYIGGGNVNIFDRDRRISVVGLVNNVNRQNFSFEDILGTTDDSAAGRAASNNNFMVRPLDGVSTVQALGVNYSDDWGTRAKIAASYLFNRADNLNDATSDKQTFTSSDKLVLYDGATHSRTVNTNHRFNSRFDYKFNDNHSLLMRTAFSVQDHEREAETFGRTQNRYGEDDIRFVYRRRSFASDQRLGVNFSNNISYRYRLPGKRYRNLTISAGGNYSDNDQQGLPRYYTFRDVADIEGDTLHYDSRSISRTDRGQPGYGVNGSATYTQALNKRSRLSVEYRCNFSSTQVERYIWIFDNTSGAFRPEPDQRQSTDYGYDYLTHRAGGSYQYLFRGTKIAASAYYQHVAFASDYALPYRSQSRASFDNLIYNLVANINISRGNLLKINADSRTRNPRAVDLQGVVNMVNRQNVFAGNPALRSVYTHTLSAQYIRSNSAKGRTFTVAAEFMASPNVISDSLVVDTPSFVIDSEGTQLGEGNQFIRPVNMPGYRRLKGSLNYGFPVKFLRSNLNLRAVVITGRMPSIINGERNRLTNDSYRLGAVLGSNISEQVDFTVSYMGAYNLSRNSSSVRSFDNTYFSQDLRADLKLAFGRFVFRGNVDYNYYKGFTDSFREERVICNLQVGCKLFRRQMGEVSVGVNDLLDDSATLFRRVVTGTYINNISNLGVGRYISMQFTYNLRLYKRQRDAVIRNMEQAR